MKKISIVLLLLIATILSANAQMRNAVPTTDEIFKVVTYRYITLKHETRDAKAVENYYTKFFKKYGYTHGLPGDGYGGPCAIIDGFYKGGYINKKKYNMFVPTKKKTASVIYMSACNDGEGDYGYLELTMTVYDKALANKVLADIKAAGFKLSNTYSNGVEEYLNGNKQVTWVHSEDNTFEFSYSIVE